ncbi:MAG: hypothetical protein UR25_C0001G0080 [Candidatus Nomurabacteria bacterium GW2011_GWE1_32_28]|uniref:Uncharacterized protein n=1 Tax=Candidatus Nomurabacteria bacterium GW2011_GWF1_31_48 TaxID=1618767 RepID=A0A0F9YGC3_9BACT|nr:MAG: hypothetical protein UR10_C0001G0033 [Candidatus Nomurabacteria bacterium GW2011_GWF2_30_133]KKP28911.1 MAG: hypothetical protein UR18_C0001G0032 [Candidatus Nomurabacteria bacterium GW2011_GWE2_31_40]KKP30649.1 MAG: hypothetical protein UR19_C0001G0033 [Candidatus Nomurabacteria bacterium GW2011_GWF1_31_48]KKP35167.1 MAG: hypothetical protein UR25_C0001G0080 [Candidatus Nomurabacteria bacterium GW2011_GWE1_32_28]HAS80477.1 hypothetical protein [Candidatus Nomurabacteria bacterium]
MKQKGFFNIIFLILAVMLASITTYLILTKKVDAPVNDNPIIQEPTKIGCDFDKDTRINIIDTFIDGWSEFEKKVVQRPVLGSTIWGKPNYYQFIGNNRMFINFEDGHIALASVVQYKCYEDNAMDFSSLEIFNDFPFDEIKWNNLYGQYGDKDYGVYSYTESIFKGGEVIKYNDWTEVPENLFILHPKGY